MVIAIFGLLAAVFLILLLLQIFTKKTINVAGYTDKSEDPNRFWKFTVTYFLGFTAAVYVILVVNNL